MHGRRFMAWAGCLCLAASPLLMSGCMIAAVSAAGAAGAGASRILTSIPANIVENNNYAADELARQANRFVTAPVSVTVNPPLNADRSGSEATPLGHVMATQLVSRFAELGYRVVDSNGAVTESLRAQPAPSPRGTPGYGGPDAIHDIVLKGYYTIATGDLLRQGDVWVTLRLLDARTGRVLASHDYTMAYDRYVRALEFPESEAGVGQQSSVRARTSSSGMAARTALNGDGDGPVDTADIDADGWQDDESLAEQKRAGASLQPVTLQPLPPP